MGVSSQSNQTLTMLAHKKLGEVLLIFSYFMEKNVESFFFMSLFEKSREGFYDLRRNFIEPNVMMGFGFFKNNFFN